MLKSNKIKEFIKSEFVLIIATILALVSVIFVPPDKEYLGYFDVKTLSVLFLMMLIIAALKNMRVFVFLAETIIKKLKNTRRIVFALTFITFTASMILANDMALLTFLPLTLTVFRTAKKEKYIPITIVLQNIAANLGGMILPFGNPQSLYLYNFFNISPTEFVKIMLMPFLVSTAMILIFLVFTHKEEVSLEHESFNNIKKPNLIIYSICFLLAVVSVFGFLHYGIVLILTVIIIFILDKKAFLKVDYSLLLTFTMFFIFASNMARINLVQTFISGLLEKNTLLTGVLSCQCFSNVPSAIFLSKFTTDYANLLRAVNIGGTGTLIASLASLISFKIFTKKYPEQKLKYLIEFSVLNFAFLIVLTVCCLI